MEGDTVILYSMDGERLAKQEIFKDLTPAQTASIMLRATSWHEEQRFQQTPCIPTNLTIRAPDLTRGRLGAGGSLRYCSCYCGSRFTPHDCVTN